MGQAPVGIDALLYEAILRRLQKVAGAGVIEIADGEVERGRGEVVDGGLETWFAPNLSSGLFPYGWKDSEATGDAGSLKETPVLASMAGPSRELSPDLLVPAQM